MSRRSAPDSNHFTWLARCGAHRKILTDIIIVELTAFDELETMAGVKTVRGAFFEGTYFNRECSRIRLFENLSEHSRADPRTLRARSHVEVVEHEFSGVVLDHYKANPLSRYLNVMGVVGFKTANKSLAGPYRIKSPDALQTFAHGVDSDGDKIVQVALLSAN